MRQTAKKSHPIFATAKYGRAGVQPSFGAELRRHRLRAGWSQARLAGASGVSRETIARIEAGRTPAAETVFAIERALGLDHLVTGWGEGGSSGAGAHGPRCRERRRQLGLTLAHVANRSGVSVATLSRFEREDGVVRSLLSAELVDDDWVLARVHCLPLAHALGFDDLDGLDQYCLSRGDGSGTS